MAITISCSCASKRFDIAVNVEPKATTQDDQEEGESPGLKEPSTISELLDVIAKESSCFRKGMRIIWRGKTFTEKDEDRLLSDIGFKDKDKIMALGKKAQGDINGEGFKRLVHYEKTHLQKMQSEYDAIDKDMVELEKMMLDNDKMLAMCKKMITRLKRFSEDGLKHMENVDALEIYGDDITEERKQVNREKRKSIINGLQTLLNLSDKFVGRVEAVILRIQKPELF
uniref:Ubiquitin-like domain-containing protein n=1 Tax=Steinernema glaseri TaxID=37863 RepID=A0A1I8APG5_9BILA